MQRLLIAMFVVGCVAPPEKPAAAPARAVEQRPAEATVVAASVDDEVVILEPVDFPPSSSAISETGSSILDALATVMKKHPEFALLEVAGHARPGVERDPLALSRARSERIVAELVLRGVAKERVIAAAYADYCPLQPEPAVDGRNGAAQFKILFVRDQGATGVNHGCPAATSAGLPPPEVAVPSN